MWEIPAQRWISANGIPTKAFTQIPSSFDDLHKPEFAPVVNILSPTATTTYTRAEKMIIETQITSTYPINRVDFSVNGSYLGTVNSMPYIFSFVPNDLPVIKNENELRVTAYDNVGNKTEQMITFTVQ